MRIIMLIYLHCLPDRIHEGINIINNEIEAIRSWAESNNLLLNDSKIKTIVIDSARYLNAMKFDNVNNILMGNNVVPFSMSIKYLGIIIINILDWNEHVKSCVKK